MHLDSLPSFSSLLCLSFAKYFANCLQRKKTNKPNRYANICYLLKMEQLCWNKRSSQTRKPSVFHMFMLYSNASLMWTDGRPQHLDQECEVPGPLLPACHSCWVEYCVCKKLAVNIYRAWHAYFWLIPSLRPDWGAGAAQWNTEIRHLPSCPADLRFSSSQPPDSLACFSMTDSLCSRTSVQGYFRWMETCSPQGSDQAVTS